MRQLLCYGDSNTWGLIPGTQKRYPWGVRWTSILQEKLREQDIRVIEEGICGRTSVYDDEHRDHRNGLKTLPLVLESHAPIDGAIIMLGTNDCKTFFHQSAGQIAHGVEQCLDSLLSAVEAENILLISPIHLGRDVWKPEYDPAFDPASVDTSRKLYGEYRKIADRKHVRIIAASDYADPSEIDQEHMTEEGHAALAEAIWSAINDTPITEYAKTGS